MSKKGIYINRSFLLFFFVVLIILASCSSNNIFTKKQDNMEMDRTIGYKYINPLLDCGVEFKEINPFVSKIRQYVNNRIKAGDAKMISVYFRHLNNGYWFGVNERIKYTPASMMKVPIMMEFLKISEFDQNIINTPILFEERVGTKNYIGIDSLVLGRSYPAIELLERMIMVSDNYAMNILYKFNRKYTTDQDLFNEVMINNNMYDRNPYDSISAKDYAGFYRILYNASFLNKEMSEAALSLLTETKFDYGLVAGVADTSIKIAHKFGERIADSNDELHDCGIIYYPDQPYILCVMTRGTSGSHKKLEKIISEISKIVYQEVDKQFRNK